MRCHRNNHDGGFSLIEVMVTLVLLGILAALVTSGTRLSLDISGRGNRRAELLRTKRIERDVFRSQLRGALPFYYIIEPQKRIERLAFEGEADHVRFVSREGLLDGPGNLPRWVELRIHETTSGPFIALTERRILAPDNLPSETTTVQAEISASCDGARFQYLDTSDEKPTWRPTWDATERNVPLPSAVRIQCKKSEDAVTALVPLDYAEPARQGLRLQ